MIQGGDFTRGDGMFFEPLERVTQRSYFDRHWREVHLWREVPR
jgi:hypothetical protein